MNYYYYRPDANNFAGVALSDEDDARIVDVFLADGRLAPTWMPISFKNIGENPRRQGDFPSLSNFWSLPVVSQRAWKALQHLSGPSCEALPAIHPSGAAFFILHMIESVDCLEESKSQVQRYDDGGIMKVDKFAFSNRALRGRHILRLPSESGGESIVDEVFRKAVETHGLEGLLFPKLPMV